MTAPSDPPFRFYDNRQKYLTFVHTCNEKWRVAERVAQLLPGLAPKPPALKILDAGVGDGTILSHVLAAMHAQYPTVPFHAVGKEISLEDVRLTLNRMANRFVEHPPLVVTLTNMHYSEAPGLRPNTEAKRDAMVFEVVELTGTSSYEFGNQIRDLEGFLAKHWKVRTSEKTGNPLYVTPTVLVLHRADQRIALDHVIPRRCDEAECDPDFDLVLACQPWRSRVSAEFKAKRVLGPLVRALGPNGLLFGVQSWGGDPGVEIIRSIWPDENPFPVDRYALLAALREELGEAQDAFVLDPLDDEASRIVFNLHTMPGRLADNIGTSTLFAAWNAATYVAQIEDDRVENATLSGSYFEAVSEVLRRHGELWFNDETFLVRRRR